MNCCHEPPSLSALVYLCLFALFPSFLLHSYSICLTPLYLFFLPPSRPFSLYFFAVCNPPYNKLTTSPLHINPFLKLSLAILLYALSRHSYPPPPLSLSLSLSPIYFFTLRQIRLHRRLLTTQAGREGVVREPGPQSARLPDLPHVLDQHERRDGRHAKRLGETEQRRQSQARVVTGRCPGQGLVQGSDLHTSPDRQLSGEEHVDR